jgi:hypothetical protein
MVSCDGYQTGTRRKCRFNQLAGGRDFATDRPSAVLDDQGLMMVSNRGGVFFQG